MVNPLTIAATTQGGGIQNGIDGHSDSSRNNTTPKDGMLRKQVFSQRQHDDSEIASSGQQIM
jgi:hypothetical protein